CCSLSDLQRWHADRLSIFGHDLQPPLAHGGSGKVAYVRPGSIARFAPAIDDERDAIDPPAVMYPLEIDRLLQAAWRIDRSEGEQPLGMQLGLAHSFEAVAGLARSVVQALRHSDVGHP